MFAAVIPILCPLHVPPGPAWAHEFTEALLDARLSRQEAAAAMGITEPQLSRALADVPGANIHLRRMAGLPERFKQHFGLRLVLRYGLPSPYLAGARAALVLLLGGAGGSKRMAAMVLEDQAAAERVS
jgi:hypothetical protein